MNLILFLLRNFRTTVVLAVFVGLIAGISGAGLIALINVRLSQDELSGARLAWGYAGMAAVVLVTNVVSQLLLIRLAQGTSYDLRMRLSRQMLAAPLRHLEELGAHRLMAGLTEDIPSIIGALLSVPSLCINFATLAVCLLYLGWLSWTMLIGVIVFMTLGVAVRQFLAMRGLRSLKLAREESNTLLSHYRAMTEGTKELKLHNLRRKEFLNDVLQSTAQTLRRHIVTGLSVYTAAESWSRLLFYLFLGLILFAMPTGQHSGHQTITGYTLIILYVMGPLTAILNLLPTMGRAKIALQHVEELRATLAAGGTDMIDDQSEPSRGWQLLELDSVTHAYHREGEEGSFTLGPIDLDFRRGELVYLVGGNGSGKTTLAKLLTGLYAPESGQIRLDGEPITHEKMEWYRQHFSVVFSDFYLFDRLLGIVSADLDGQAKEYLGKLQLAHKVQVKDGVLSTTNLSYGQRKRLALLTAYLEDRPFYVFDEWAAGQDPMFKELFYFHLLPELKRRGKTVLIISHDEKYFHLADRLIKLDYGKIDYNPDELAVEETFALDVLCEATT